MRSASLLKLVRRLARLIEQTYRSWRDDRTIRLGAGLAYYGLFSLSSVLAVALGLFRIIGRSPAVEEALTERLEELLSNDQRAEVAAFFESMEGSRGTQLGLIGFGALLVTGSLFFLALTDALNQIWDAPVRVGIKSTLRRRLVSLVVLLGAATALVVSFTVQAASSLLEAIVPGSGFGASAVATLFTSGASWSVLGGALTLLFRYLPPVDVAWRPAITSAVLTAVFLVIGSAVIAWYLRTAGSTSVVGVLSTPLAILVWIYYEAQILLAGAQLAKILNHDLRPAASHAGGVGIEPVAQPPAE